MQSLRFHSKVDANGIVHLQVPVELANSELELVLVYQPIEKKRDEKIPTELGYPEDFFEKTFGAWQGEPLTRAEQGECDQRDWDLL